MKKIIIIGVPVVLLLLVMALYFYFLPTKVLPVDTSVTELPSAQSTQTNGVTTTPVVLKGNDGNDIRVKDFIAGAREDPYNEGHFYLQPINGDTTYQIEYISATQFFNISLLVEPIGHTRLEAETYLKNILGISDSELCSIAYSVAVPNSVNTTYSGTNVGFSFCPNAIKLP